MHVVFVQLLSFEFTEHCTSSVKSLITKSHCLPVELDRLYFDSAKKDVLKFIKKPCKKDRLWKEVKIFSKKIKEL